MADEPAKIILGDTAISAIEGTPGRRWFHRKKDREKAPTRCENCGAELQGHWCAHCGQPAIDYRRSFRHVIADLLDEFLNWDSKFFATIALLIFKPWRLTNEFLAGKRVRYANPLRLYLLASILFFFAVNYGTRGIKFEPGKIGPKDRAELEADLKNTDLPPKAREKLQALLQESSPSPAPSPVTSPSSPPPSAQTERQIAAQIDEISRPAHSHRHVAHCIFQDQVPTDDPRHDLAECRIGICIGRSRNRNHRREFGVTKRRKRASDARHDERHGDGGTCAGSSKEDVCTREPGLNKVDDWRFKTRRKCLAGRGGSSE